MSTSQDDLQTVTLTREQRETLSALIGNALDQDHDSIDGSYLWFLTPDGVEDQAEIAKVREQLEMASKVLAR